MTSEREPRSQPVDRYADSVRLAGSVMVLLAAEIRRDLEEYCTRNPLPPVIRSDQPYMVDLQMRHALLGRALEMEARGLKMAGVDALGSMTSPMVKQTTYLKLMGILARMDPVGEVLSL